GVFCGVRQLPAAGSQLTTTVFFGTERIVQFFGICFPRPLGGALCTSAVWSSCSLVGSGPAFATCFGLNRYHCDAVPLAASALVAGAESRSNRLPVAIGTCARPLTEGPVRSASKS